MCMSSECESDGEDTVKVMTTLIFRALEAVWQPGR